MFSGLLFHLRIFALAAVLSSLLVYNLPETVRFDGPRCPQSSPLLIFDTNLIDIYCTHFGYRFVKLISPDSPLLLNLVKNSMEGLVATISDRKFQC